MHRCRPNQKARLQLQQRQHHMSATAAEAIADVMGTNLLLAAHSETFMLSSMPIWIRPVAVELSVSKR
jgi:hypothetical protein